MSKRAAVDDHVPSANQGLDAAERVPSCGATLTVQAAGQPQCILVVEDDPSIRSLCAEALGAQGYRVETAVDGHDGLDRLSSGPDLILLDLMMPRVDGYEFLRQLRKGSPDGTPAVVMTATHGLLTLEGAQRVMHKPFELDALLGAVSELLPN